MKKKGDALKSLKFPEIVARINSPFAGKGGGQETQEDIFDSGFELVITAGPNKGKVFPLTKKEVTLGKQESPGEIKKGFVLFDDPSVSRVHAVLRWDDELEKYVIYHLSKTSPTQVNGRVIKKSLLNPNYAISLGNIELKVISVKEKRHEETAKMWEKFKSGEERSDSQIESGYKLVVVEGPDKGTSFELDKNLLVIGKRKGAGDIRDTYGILLSDENLPDELALLVWNKNHEKYEIFQSEESPISIRLFRVVETEEGSSMVGREYQNILEDKDAVMAGETVMVIHKTTEEETHDVKVDIQKEMQVSQAVQVPVAGLTAPGSFRVDFVFEVTEGANVGYKISLLSSEMVEGKIITFGVKGVVRQNDIELDDPSLSNTQGYFEFSEGNLYLINESAGVEVMVNAYEINENEKIVLNGGDRIKLGNTQLSFTDNRVLAALRNYALVVISGVEQDKNKRFPFTRTTAFIGRGSACDVRLYDPEISRLHAVVSFKTGRFHLEHQSKVNPTFVNGVSLPKGQDRIIFPGDKIYLSGTTIVQLVRTAG